MSALAVLAGYKTYFVALGLAAVAAAKYMGYIDAETAATITILLTGGGLAALRAGAKKETEEVKATVAVVAGKDPEKTAEKVVAVAEKAAGKAAEKK